MPPPPSPQVLQRQKSPGKIGLTLGRPSYFVTNLSKGRGGGAHLDPPPPQWFPKWLQIDDQALSCKQRLVS